MMRAVAYAGALAIIAFGVTATIIFRVLEAADE